VTDAASASRIKDADRGVLRAVLAREKRVLVEFWAPWCVQCAPMARVVERFVDELADDVAVLKVSLEDESIADDYGLMTLPAICLFIEGEQSKLVTGFKGAPALRQEFASLVA
jgi:thioredoxin 1